MANNDDFIYDEEESVKFIKNFLPQELKEKFSDDDIYYIVDLIYEYYDKQGFFDEDMDDNQEVDIDEEDLTKYVVKNAKKDGIGKFTDEDVMFVVQGEMAYCESINMFD